MRICNKNCGFPFLKNRYVNLDLTLAMPPKIKVIR